MLDNLLLALIIIVYFFFRIYFSENNFSEFTNRIKRLLGYKIKSNETILRENLETSNTYFRSLSEKGKFLMMNKCFAFMKSKSFVGMQG